ncbi:MAG: NosD domain-containing protein [Desulfotomaculaceae bacterium]|nr:NosD domain-containing protein [Desulfotomaculaceae bacterium]
MRVFSKQGLGKLVFIFLMLGLFLGLGGTMPAVAAEISVTVTGDGVTTPTTFTQADLEAMDQVQACYSSINTWPTKKMYVAEGVRLADLLTVAGVTYDANLIKIRSTDGFSATFTVKELLEDTRYYYPGLQDNHEYFGYIPGSMDGAVEVDTILALANAEGDNFNYLDDRDAPIFMMGQRYITEQTNSAFAKYVGTIEVTTGTPDKWENPVAAPTAGTVAAGTKVALSTSDMDGDNIHYTTDGSEPTFESPMYNWIKKRWWNSRSDDLATINHPIDVNQDITIKAVTIGFGKEDSDIVTFEYQIPSVDVTGVSIAEDDQALEVGQTRQLTAVIEPENATDKDVGWSTSNEAIATVSESGLVTAVSEGTAEITVTTVDGDFTDTITVTITPAEAKTWYVDDSGSADFTTIQAAVTAAGAGDTIIVRDGTYSENVVVDKSLVIQSENGADQTIVQAAASNADVIKVTAANVTIDGFTLSGGKSGIVIWGSSSSSCTVKNNLSSGNNQGISIEALASSNTVSNNVVTQSGSYGIYLTNTTGNSITGNTCSNITGSEYVYALYLADNADNNTVSGNTSDSNNIGIRVKAADSNSIFNNTFSNNNFGMEIATKPVSNVIYLNNFTGNTSGQLSAGYGAIAGNFWNSQVDQTYMFNGAQYTGPVGNYWSSYTGADADGNGIGDTPYQTISTDNDNYPLMGQWQDGVITAPAVAPEAAFTADPTSGDAPLTVQFTDQSTNTPAFWEWDFDNDGTVDSTEQNPSYEYISAGTYSVKLTVTNSIGSDDEVKTDYITVTGAQSIDVLYDGTVTLTPEKTFTVKAYNSETDYTVDEDTPIGALQAAADASDFEYDVTDKNYTASGALLLDNVGDYPYVKGGSQWYAYVNGDYKDGYNNADGALNLIKLVNGDKVEFYYAAGITDETDFNAVKAAATAAVKTVVSISAADVLYEGTVTLTPEKTFTVKAYNSDTDYTVDEDTPIGALQAAADASDFEYDVTDKNYTASGALLLDNVGDYPYVKGGSQWYAYVNGDYKDGYNNADGALNLIKLVNGDKVDFYYADGITDETDFNAVKAAATAAVKTVVSTDGDPDDWTLQLSGAKNASVTKAQFEEALACSSSGHQVSWTDDDGNVWGGVPLWLLVAMVDDDPDVGSDHINFNDALAAQNYEVNVIAGDDWAATLDSAAIARNNGYIVANTLNGDPLPLKTESDKGCWPLFLKGSAVFGGQQVGNIVRIELTGLPAPQEGWTLEMLGDVGDTITQEEFEEGLACTGSGHYQEWTDNEGNVWSGVPLWVLLGVVDDIETGSHWTFNDALATNGYSVKVVAGDDFFKTFDSAAVAGSNDFIVANKMNGEPLTEAGPLRLVGDGVTKDDGSLSGASVGNIEKIEIPELQTPAAEPGSWNLTLNGKISDVFSQAEFEAGLACPSSGHLAEWTDGDDNVWSGIPLWFLAGWVDDRQPHDYNANQATAGYTILVKAGDGYTKDFASAEVAWSDDYIIANKINGALLTESGPLRLVGAGVASAEGALSGKSVGNIKEIELTSFETSQAIPGVHIIKYAEDGVTIIDEITVDYQWMENESGLDVIGDGTTVYRYEGITNDPDDVWDADETYPGGYKIENAVKGTRIKDLCELVGGMGAGTEIVLVAEDEYETRLPYSSIYTDPSVQARQGDAILAWWADGKYVPDYKDGMRLFFTPDDHIYGQWDMHETLSENYWHYYYGGGVQYPSCAGLSAKLIDNIEIYSVPQGDWTLELDGQDVGGMSYDVSKTYFESALACQFGANHKATYTDSQNRVWEGMPLWFLAGFVDDADQHSDNAFNDALAAAGYQVVITAADDYSVTIDSADIIRNSDYIIANTLDGAPIPESDDNWPLRLVGPAVTGGISISQIESIKLVSSGTGNPVYTVTPEADAAYTAGTTQDGINTMTVKDGVTGFKYFAVSVTPVTSHNGNETVIFAHFRNGSQLGLNATRADFDQVEMAQAGFNVISGDVIKAYIVDDLTNAVNFNPTILQ